MPENHEQNVSISRQFLRSVNLEADLGRSDALQGYICQNTASGLIKTMAHHLNETRQRAFTWTGPYGGGKSSLALALGSLVSPNKELRASARKILHVDEEIDRAWSTGRDGWLVLPVVGKRDSVINAISTAINKATGSNIKRPKAEEIILRLVEEAECRKKGGVLVILDELGKFLESAAQTGEDIYFYQNLGEAASRSNGKLVIVGILHQAFEQYATKLGRETRDEWSKIQGRYIDIPLIAGTDEVLELVSRAIEKKNAPVDKTLSKFAEIVSESIRRRRASAPANLKNTLLNCWPLHPVTAALLGPVSKKRFSQNERSIFGFLSSVEPLGFTDFLKSVPNHPLALYGPSRYWDYLTANLEQAILASSDGHRWLIAKDAIERTEAREGCTLTHVKLAKTIALIDMFRSGSGLTAEDEVLDACIENISKEEIRSALKDLKSWSVIVFRKHLNSWAIYSGSDFDIDSSVNQARSELGDINVKQLVELSELNPVVAKKHYHETGTLRWFTRSLVQSKSAMEYISSIKANAGSSGEFILVFPSSDFNQKKTKAQIKSLSELSTESVVLGYASNSEKVYELGIELAALEKVQKTSRELEGDAVARKEVNGRIVATKSELSDELKNSFEMADWFCEGVELKKEYKSSATLSAIASSLAEKIYPDTPHIHNELVNHETISGNAVKARKQLMYQMLKKYGEERLGYSGSSSDAGLYYSVIEQNNLYQRIQDKWVFTTTDQEDNRARHFHPIWQEANKLMRGSNGLVTLTEIYKKWQDPTIGVKKGLLPILALIYFLANRQHLGLYIENTFITDLNEAYLDEWMQITDRVAFKYVEIGKNEKDLLKALSESLTKKLGKPVADSPLESARGLVHLVANLPGWTKRTSNISQDAQNLRRLLLKASDPLKVIFTDLPEILKSNDAKSLINKISDLTEELQNAYPAMLKNFESLLFKALDNHGGPEELRSRASDLKGTAGEFKVDGFVANLSVFTGDHESLERLLSSTIHKNPKEWVDRDQELVINSLGEICSKFRRIEALGSLRGKSSKRSAFAFVYTDPNNSTVSDLFDISEARLPEIQIISKAILKDLKKQGLSKDEMLATFSEACSNIIRTDS
jgi:hypothetical protein